MNKLVSLALVVMACIFMPTTIAELAKIGPYNITYSTGPGIATFIGVPYTIDTYSGEQANIYSLIMANILNNNAALIWILPDGVPNPTNYLFSGPLSSDLTINKSLNNPRDLVNAYVNDSSMQEPTYYDRMIDGRPGIIAVPTKKNSDPYVAVYFLNESTPVVIVDYMSWENTRNLLNNLRIVYEGV